MAQLLATIQVRGLDSLDAALRRLPVEVAGPIMADALAAGGEVVRAAAADNIHSRTGATAKDLRVEVRNQPARFEGAAGVGGTKQGTTGRQHVLRWLEFGAKPHKIEAGAQDRRDARRAIRALRRLGEGTAAAALRTRVRQGTGIRRALSLPGGIFRAAVNHPGVKSQSPLTRALAEAGDRAIQVFKNDLWRGIAVASNRLKGQTR